MKTKSVRIALKLALIICTVGLSEVRAAEDRPNAPVPVDKAAHFGLAATAQTGCYAAAKAVTKSKWGSQIGCFVLINAAGAAKEYTDPRRGGTRDVNDIYANMAGSGLSFMMIGVAF